MLPFSRPLIVTVAASGLLSSVGLVAGAQGLGNASAPTSTMRGVSGIVFDSLESRPLSGARVHMSDLDRYAVSDESGHFHFDSVGIGQHTIWADHPVLDQLGLYSLQTTIDVLSQRDALVDLAVPSFSTLWRKACAGEPPRSNNGFIYGQIGAGPAATRMTGTAVVLSLAGDSVEGSSDAPNGVQQRVLTNASGSYSVCDIPTRRTVTLSATSLGMTTSPVSFQIGEMRIARRDLTLPTLDAMTEAAKDSSIAASPGQDQATVAGTVRDSAAQPIEDVRIKVSGVNGEWHPDAMGKFLIHGIPPGTRIVSFSGIGILPERKLVDLAFHDSAFLELTTARIATRLNAVTVRERARINATRADLIGRCRAGFGYCADSSALDKVPVVWDAFNFPGVQAVHNPLSFPPWTIEMKRSFSLPAKGTRGTASSSAIALTCTPTLWIDGTVSDIEILNAMSKDEIGVIEVYNSAAGTPAEYAGSRTNCGVVLIWRKSYIGT